ncbi:hypothetical protein BJX99DRAFT_240382 [Aspergillus californicus]
MRFNHLAAVMALVATVASAHTVNCAGKAIAAPMSGLDSALYYLKRLGEGQLWNPPRRDVAIEDGIEAADGYLAANMEASESEFNDDNGEAAIIGEFGNAREHGFHELGPNSCEQVACKGDAQIRWCNDDPNKARIMANEHIREGATVLRNECKKRWKGKDVAGGQLTHPDNWSVVVQRVDQCRY